MATLTWYSGLLIDPMKVEPIVKVNGNFVSQPYTLKDGDVITVSVDSHLVIVNNKSYLLSQTISLSDIDIYAYGDYMQTPKPMTVTVTINYSESGGGWQYA